MVTLGKYNVLTIVKTVTFGVYLDGGDQGEILLPQRYVRPEMHEGMPIEVFIYLDGEERIIATTDRPYAQVGEVAFLKVKSVERIGAFLDWGIMKDILVPFSEQKIQLEVGKKYIVYVYEDKLTKRIVATTRIERFLSKNKPPYHIGDSVHGIIYGKTPLGYKVVFDHAYQGLLYKTNVFQELDLGQTQQMYITKIRDDGKIDLALEKQGVRKRDDISEKVLQKIKEKGGRLPLHDKSKPEEIYALLGMSKRNFKEAIGKLYKERVIDIQKDAVVLSNI